MYGLAKIQWINPRNTFTGKRPSNQAFLKCNLSKNNLKSLQFLEVDLTALSVVTFEGFFSVSIDWDKTTIREQYNLFQLDEKNMKLLKPF